MSRHIEHEVCPLGRRQPVDLVLAEKQLAVAGLAGACGDQDVLEDRHRREQAHGLERADDAAARGDAVRRPGCGVFAEEGERPRTRLLKAAQDVQERGLAGPVGTDDAADLTLGHAERDVLDRVHTAELLRESLYIEGYGAHDLLPARLDRARRTTPVSCSTTDARPPGATAMATTTTTPSTT